MAETLCGIEIGAVHEIILMQDITPVPKSPRNVLGATNVRGVVLSVVDLRACLGFPSAANTADTRIVLVSYGEEKIGLVVDGVAEVITLPLDAFQSLNGNIGQSAFLRSVARLEDRLILDIDHERVVEDGLHAEPAEIPELLKVVEAEAAAEAEEQAEEEAEPEAEAEAEIEEEEEQTEVTTEDTTTDAKDEGGLNIELLESSFELLAPQGDELVERFYEKLFETAPAVRNLFPDDMASQKKALLGSLAAIVGSLRNPEKLGSYLAELGQHHVTYGAQAAHYDVVAQVLIETMAELAGDVWNDELQTAWTDALTAVKGLMLAGAEQQEKAA